MSAVNSSLPFVILPKDVLALKTLLLSCSPTRDGNSLGGFEESSCC
jgi:hypothetical protein